MLLTLKGKHCLFKGVHKGKFCAIIAVFLYILKRMAENIYKFKKIVEKRYKITKPGENELT